jgi:hypothetical protein
MAIHRFKFSSELNEEIIKFSQIHLHDENNTLKEQFDDWMKKDNISELIENENNFLQRHNYDTSTIDVKIFKSIKYYYIKKFMTDKKEENEEYKIKKRLIKRLPIELKEQIQVDLNEHFKNNPEFKPSDTYLLFKHNFNNITEEVVKKCYKNQYYQLKHKKYADTVNEK